MKRGHKLRNDIKKMNILDDKSHFGIFPELVVLPLAVTTAFEVGKLVAAVICGNPLAPLICDCVIKEEDPYIAGNIQ